MSDFLTEKIYNIGDKMDESIYGIVKYKNTA